ncbi:hypothetical protein [Burkholderia cenocepacia]|uniref:hypothetical protein n=1 Tax=Burkholderia cenocepacia TaxID=95486 RepID=UPI001F498EEB|nr:hypothetical protein [Burkholderia cenocepacia]
MLNAEYAPRQAALRGGAAAAGQCAAQPILATKSGEFNRPEMTMTLRHEDDQIISN